MPRGKLVRGLPPKAMPRVDPACRTAAAMASRIWRLIRFRVTERRALRLGTTVPNHHPKVESSTGGVQLSSSPVDNSVQVAVKEALFPPLAGAKGRAATWCAAKCALRERGIWESTRWKSALRRLWPMFSPSAFTTSTFSPCAVGSSTFSSSSWSPSRAGSLTANRLGALALTRSDLRQALAALGTAGGDHGPTTPRFHANEEAVGAGAANFGRLVGALHGGGVLASGKPMIRARIARLVKLAPGQQPKLTITALINPALRGHQFTANRSVDNWVLLAPWRYNPSTVKSTCPQ